MRRVPQLEWTGQGEEVTRRRFLNFQPVIGFKCRYAEIVHT